jgi:hypothetical protein
MYPDFGYVLKNVSTDALDDYNQPITTLSEIPKVCSFTDKVTTERWENYADFQDFVAEVRFEGQPPEKGDSFKICNRYGHDVTEQTYEIAGIKDRGLSFVCALKKVQL